MQAQPPLPTTALPHQLLSRWINTLTARHHIATTHHPRTAVAALCLAAVCGLGGLAMGGLVMSGQAAHAADAPAHPARPAMTVTTTQPQRANLAVALAANGNVAAWQEASVGAQANGLRLAEVRVNVGDVVKAGQVLAVFAQDTVQADVAQARASLAEAQANAQEANANALRAQTLQDSGALSQQQIQQFATGAKTAQARVQAAKAALDAQLLRLQQTQVLAPDGGVISARTATVGAVLGAGTELFRMVRQGRLEWRAEVTAQELPRLRTGTKVRVTTAAGGTVQGTLRMVAPTVDPQTRNALVYVDLPPMTTMAGGNTSKDTPANAVLPGMFARGEFQIGQSDALTVPQEALVVRDGFSYVFAVDAQARVQQRKVQTGRRVGDKVEILSGLDAQTTIAVRGAGFLNDADLVRVTTATTSDAVKPAPATGPATAPASAAVTR